MKRTMACACLLAILATVASKAGPVTGTFTKKVQLRPAGEASAEMDFHGTFKGGQRACVIARGDHDPVVGLELTVYNADGQVEARDESRGDILSVIWAPARTAEYRIVLRNRGKLEEYGKYEEPKKYTEVYLSFR